MKRRKVLSILLVTAMAFSLLTGCTSEKEPASGEEKTAENGDEITITYMCSGVKAAEGEDFESETLPRLVKEKYPNVNLEVTKLPDDQYYTALKTKLATGEAPDMFLVQPRYAGVNATFTLAEAGYLEDISDLNAVENVGSGVESFRYEGKIYGIPGGVTYLGTYYNKDVFEENNISVPTNWQEFLEACETLKNAGIQPIVMGDKDMYVMQFGLYQLAANLVYPEDPEFDEGLRDGTKKFTDEGTWDLVLERYYELYEKGYVQSGSLGLGVSQAQQKFIDGEAAMIFDGTFNRKAVEAEGATSFERGYFPLPGNDEGKQLYTAGAPGGGPAIYSGSKNTDICKEIIELWFDGESDLYKAYESNGRFISTNEGAEVDPMYADFMKLYNEGNSFYWCNQAWPAGTETEMETLFGELIGGAGTTIPDITSGMQNKLEELLNQ
ncbi:MAG TPA: extracellular solute-binding protein [Candidatus Merdenecus merdavium]|nr:extracellular solute-binding protein [Candidatus Merdenecus merdavium]